MNNTQFRRLVLSQNEAGEHGNEQKAKKMSGGHDGVVPPLLGSKARPSVVMTPRALGGRSSRDVFAQQLAERRAEQTGNGNGNGKGKGEKGTTGNIPKGTRLAAGYQDRTLLRQRKDQDANTEKLAEDDKARRVQALENMVRLGQMDQATFIALRDEIVGGQVEHVHLVKGLDFKLLERVKRGEDVMANRSDAHATEDKDKEDEEGDGGDGKDKDNRLDDQFDELEQSRSLPQPKSTQSTEHIKRGVMAPPPPPPPKSQFGSRQTRDDILKALKASRGSCPSPSMPVPAEHLGARFRKIDKSSSQTAMPRIERDEKGREILITTDADGRVKRKIRRSGSHSHPPLRNPSAADGLLLPDKTALPLDHDVQLPASHANGPTIDRDSKSLDIDADIFEGVGTDFDPLGDRGSESDDDRGAQDQDEAAQDNDVVNGTHGAHDTVHGHDSHDKDERDERDDKSTQSTSGPRNYFGDAAAPQADGQTSGSLSLTDPTVLAALKRAAALGQPDDQDRHNVSADGTVRDQHDADQARRERHKRMLEGYDRDADDIDMGFGNSRFADGLDDDDDGGDGGMSGGKNKKGQKRVKLSEWTGLGGDGPEGDANSKSQSKKSKSRNKNKKA